MYEFLEVANSFVLSVLAFGIFNFVTMSLLALLGRAFGIGVKEVSVGFGPNVFKRQFDRTTFQVRLLPLNGSVSFLNSQDDAIDPEAQNDLWNGMIRFDEAPISVQLALNFFTMIVFIVVGVICLTIPILVQAQQVVVNSNLAPVWKKTGVPHLTLENVPASWNGQYELCLRTGVDCLVRIVTFQRLDGWGGVIGFFATLGQVGLTTTAGWLSCFGAFILVNGLAMLLPIPGFNGFSMLYIVAKSLVGPKTGFEKVWQRVGWLMLLLLGYLYVRLILLDLSWLIS